MTNKIKALCPNCGGLRNCAIHGEVATSWEDPQCCISGSHHHRLLQCSGCDSIFYHLNENFSEHTIQEQIDGEFREVPIDMVTTYPSYEENLLPSWMSKLESADAQLFQIFNEVYFTSYHDHLILSSIGLRTIFDRTSELLKIHPGLSLNAKIAKLKDEGFIGDTESKILSTIVDAGSAAAHRGWIPGRIEFKQMLRAIENFVQRTVLTERSLAHIKQKIPPFVKKPQN